MAHESYKLDCKTIFLSARKKISNSLGLQRLECGFDPEVPDGERADGEDADPHGSDSLPRVQEHRGQLRLQGRQGLQSACRRAGGSRHFSHGHVREETVSLHYLGTWEAASDLVLSARQVLYNPLKGALRECIKNMQKENGYRCWGNFLNSSSS